MKSYSISQLARAFGLSRSTLLYYDRIGLLQAPERSAAGYRLYTEREYRRLERICMFRGLGLPLADIGQLLAGGDAPDATILEKRLRELGAQILALRSQQHLIIAMLKRVKKGGYAPVIDKQMWVKMLAAAGMDDDAMAKWHAEFERLAPEAHHDLMISLGIAEHEVRQIQQWARRMNGV